MIDAGAAEVLGKASVRAVISGEAFVLAGFHSQGIDFVSERRGIKIFDEFEYTRNWLA